MLRTFSIFFLLAISGCSLMRAPLDTEQAINQRTFLELKRYYCENDRWPNSFNDLVLFSKSSQDDPWVTYYENPKFRSERLIVTSLAYRPTRALVQGEKLDKRIVTFIAPPICEDREVLDGFTPILGSRVQVKLPEGFAPMTALQMQERWGKGPYPDVAWLFGDQLIALRFGEALLKRDRVSEFLNPLVIAYENATPGIVWRAKNIADTAERTWLDLSFESPSKKGELFSRVISTSFKERLFSLSIVGPFDQSAALEGVASELMQSIQLLESDEQQE